MKIKTNRIIAAAGVVALAASALGFAGAAEAKTAKPVNKTIHVFLSADTNIQVLWEQKLVPAFVAANPGYKVDVVLDLHGAHDAQTTAKITAASITKKDPGYDVIDGGFVTNLGDSALLVNPTSKLIPNLKDVPSTLIDQGHGGGIPYRGSSVLLAYNSTKVTAAPKTFDDLITWIKANPGKFTYNTPASGGSGKSFVTAAVDKFTSAADRTKMTNDYVPELESDWSQGFALLASLNPYVYQKGVYPTGNAAILNLLASGEISMAPVWSDQFNTGLDNGTIPNTIKTTQISGPSMTGGAAFIGIPKASPRQAAAEKLVNFVLSPAGQEIIATQMNGYPVIDLAKVSPATRGKFIDADIPHLRAPLYSTMGTDLANQWATQVPGK